jgi:ATP-dependent Clp protease ATP-binding subunit ClpC
MLCQNCGQRAANFRIVGVMGNQRTTMSLCMPCASEGALTVDVGQMMQMDGVSGSEGGKRRARVEKDASVAEGLAAFTRNLSADARDGKLDVVVGRERELERVIRVLARRTKNNPVLLGEPGVGKTAIAEALALRIRDGLVPSVLREKQVLALDLTAILAGAKYRGEFEERLKGVVEALKAHKDEYVLFIDELHTLMGAGAAEGSLDASNILKPALARGELQVIGATTRDEYRKHIEKDAAFERRFQPVVVEEPTVEAALAILKGLRPAYEKYHQVSVMPEAIEAAVTLSVRYVADRFLPDKAIDLLDEACAMSRIAQETGGVGAQALRSKLAQLESHKARAVQEERYTEAAWAREEILKVNEELTKLPKEGQASEGALPVVDARAIATVVSEWTGIPAYEMGADERVRLQGLEQRLKQRVIGQDAAVSAVAQAVRRARSGLKDVERPIGSFIFLGPTGVGKTELARALAYELFHDEKAMIRLDMSEYQEKHTVARLVGAPPGYVGHEDAGQLTEAVRRKPFSLILFDEIEKAHPDVFNTLLQILDDGRLTDSQGRTVDFKNTVIIMTSNVGAQHLVNPRAKVGFASDDGTEAQWETLQGIALDALKQAFRPEFLNRVDETIVFKPLSRTNLLTIVDLMLARTERKLASLGVKLVVSSGAKGALAQQGYDPHLGARPLRRLIQRAIETPISDRLLDNPGASELRIQVDYTADGFTVTHELPVPAAVK